MRKYINGIAAIIFFIALGFFFKTYFDTWDLILSRKQMFLLQWKQLTIMLITYIVWVFTHFHDD